MGQCRDVPGGPGHRRGRGRWTCGSRSAFEQQKITGLAFDAGKYCAAPGLSKACKAFVIDRLVHSIQPPAILQQWKAEMHVKYAQKHGLLSAQAAERAMNQVFLIVAQPSSRQETLPSDLLKTYYCHLHAWSLGLLLLDCERQRCRTSILVNLHGVQCKVHCWEIGQD